MLTIDGKQKILKLVADAITTKAVICDRDILQLIRGN